MQGNRTQKIREFEESNGGRYGNQRRDTVDLNQDVGALRSSAEQGNALAQFDLARCLANGQGCVKDEKRAFEHYQTLAQGGDINAQNSLAFCFLMGKGVPKDEEKAFKLLRIEQNIYIPKVDEVFASLERDLKEKLKNDFKKHVPDTVTENQVNFHPRNNPSTIEILKAIRLRTRKLQEKKGTQENKQDIGYCFGSEILVLKLALLGLSLDKLIDFYIMLIRFSIDMPQEDQDKIVNMLIELVWSQWHSNYKSKDGKELTHRDVHIILKDLTGLPINNIFASCPGQTFTRHEFNMLLNMLNEHTVISLANVELGPNEKHAIAIVRDKEGNFIITDANYNSLIKIFPPAQQHLIFDEVRKCLYRSYEKNFADKVPLVIDIVHDKRFSKENSVIHSYRKRAEDGDAEAQYVLGYHLFYGIGVSRNEKQAFEWFRKAALQGHIIAQYSLAQCFDEGTGVQKDAKEALKWYRIAAENGHKEAQCHFGFCLLKGIGVGQDEKSGVEWLQISAGQGCTEAQNQLGHCFLTGMDVAKDEKQAVEWFRRTAENHDAYGQFCLGSCLENGKGATKDEKAAVEWYRRAAHKGHAQAQYELARCLGIGKGCVKDDEKSFESYRNAAEQGHVGAQFNLAMRLSHGLGCGKNDKAAADWLRKAADQGHAQAQHHLATRLINGYGVAKEKEAAVKWFRSAADKGHKAAQDRLAVLESPLHRAA